MSPTKPRTLQRSALYSTLTANQRHNYADALAHAIHRHHGIPACTPEIPQGETPAFRIVGAHQHTKPRALDVRTRPEPRYNTPAAHIAIGGFEYDQALSSMLPDLYVMWFKWLHTDHAPSLIRTEGQRILLDDANWNATAKAAMWILSFAWVDIWE